MTHIAGNHAYVDRLVEEVNKKITNLQVSFMNTAGVMVVVTVLANFEIKIVLDL